MRARRAALHGVRVRMSQNSDQLDAAALGQYLKELRGDVPQFRAAKLVGTYQSNLKNWENGAVVPSVGSLYAIARGYGVPLEGLIARLVPDYRRTSDERIDEVVRALLETTSPDALTPSAVLGALELPTPPPLDAEAVEDLVVSAVADPMAHVLAELTRATSLDDPVRAVVEVLGDLASRLPGTVFSHRDAYPADARRLLERYDRAITRAAQAVAGDDPTRRLALGVRFAGWTEAARVVAEMGGRPIQRREAVVLALGG